jgi:hypothetical protein
MSTWCTLRRVSEATLAELAARPSGICEFLEKEGFAAKGLGKAWAAIHFLLAGPRRDGSTPLNFLVAGGCGVGTSKSGVLVRGFTRAEVREIWQAVEPISTDVLTARYDRDRDVMYQLDMYVTPPEYVAEQYDRLRECLEAAVREGQALIVSYG